MSDLTTFSFSSHLSRRSFLGATAVGVTSLALAGCTMVTETPPPVVVAEPGFGDYAMMYGPKVDGGYQLPAIPLDKMDPQFLRQVVRDPTGERPGTIVVDTSAHFLYLVREGGQAVRYGVGLGRAGFEWAGNAVIQWKQKWPKWTPPAEMIARDPSLEKYSAENGSMAPGLTNPLGARALYIFQNDEDTLFRLHGTPEWSSIGKSVSSGCVRLMNQDIIDLYDRVPSSAPIIVTSGLGSSIVASSARRRGLPMDSGVPRDAILLRRL